MNNDFPAPAMPMPPPPPAAFNPIQGAPRLERAVERANSELANALTGLDKAFDELLKRLDPVLTPAAPAVQVAGQPMPPQAPKCELAGSIERKASAVLKLLARVEAVTNRLEL